MEFPSYIILSSYTMDRDNITFNIKDSDYKFYLEWMGCADEWTFKNNVNVRQYKADSIFFTRRIEDKWIGFVLKGVQPRSLSLYDDNEYQVTLMYDQYKTVTTEYINEMNSEIRKDKINNLL